MAPSHAAAHGYYDQRSQQQTTSRSGGTNAQQFSTPQQMYNASFWENPASTEQYYRPTQIIPQSSSLNNTSYIVNRQDTQSFDPTSFGDPSFQTFNPAAQMFHDWSMAQSGYNPSMQFSAQQFPMQQMSVQQTPCENATFGQTSVQQAQAQPQNDVSQNSNVIDGYSGSYVDFDMDDDPSAQLMAELTQDVPESARSLMAPEASDKKYQDSNQGWGSSVVHSSVLDPPNSMVSNAQTHQNADLVAFKSFESQNPVTEFEKAQEDQLVQQVEQVVADLIDEGMQDAVPEAQTTVGHIPEYIDTTIPTTKAHDTIADDGLEGSTTAREVSFPINETEHRDDVAAGPVDGSNDVEEEAIMPEGIAQEHVVDDLESHDDGFDHDLDRDTLVKEDTIESDTAEDEDAIETETAEDEDVAISDAEPSSDQEAHDSNAEVTRQVEFEGYTLTEIPQKTIKKTIAKKEDRELHHKASKLQPHHLPEHRYWAAILMHTVQPHKAKVEKDFVWLKGHKNNTVETMWNRYREVTTEEQHQILFCGRVPSFTDTLEELDRFGDKLIVFRAAKQEIIVID
ncbi:hypothetical protein QM012_005740 [Aureobasidium pullulans]|uniref:Uncharacterized protein n=1 Tax=Aureobasidium pullulans TaxID=5580 RepID=A0ABR0TQY8_AURPU